MAESQKYGKWIGAHFGWQCIINLEKCPSAAHTTNRKPACKSCKVARALKKGELKIDRGSVYSNYVVDDSAEVFDIDESEIHRL